MSFQTEPRHDWNSWNVTCLWAGVVISLPAYTMGGILITLYSLNLTEAFFTILLSVSISYGLHFLGAKPGIKYRKGSQDLLKISFGNIGAKLPVILRGLLVAGWFGIDVIFGGMAINLLLKSLLPITFPQGEVVGFFIFLVITFSLVTQGKDTINKLEVLAVPGLLIIGLLIAVFVYIRIPEYSIQSDKIILSEISLIKISSSMVVVIGNLVLMTLAMPDFSQFTKSQKDYNVGLFFGLEVTFLLFCLLGAFVSYYSELLTGVKSFDLITFISTLEKPMISIVASMVLVIALLTTATVDLFVSTTDLSKTIIKNGKTVHWVVYLVATTIISTLLVSAELINKISNPTTDSNFQYWFDIFLKGASSILTSVVAIYILEFHIIKPTNFSNDDNFKSDVDFSFSALSIVLLSLLLTIAGFIFDEAHFMIKFGWLINFMIACIGYYLLKMEVTQRYIKTFSYTRFL